MLNPDVTLSNQALKRVKSLLTEFGMTPSSRSRIVVGFADDPSADEWKDL